MLAFFLPWTRVSLLLDPSVFPKSQIEVGTQSGFQMIFARFSSSPAIEPFVQVYLKEEDELLRHKGLDPVKVRAEEAVTESLKYGALRLSLYPVGPGVVGLLAVVSKPTRFVLAWAFGALLLVGLISFAPFADGSPTESTITASLAKQYGIYGALLALQYEVHYTFWFNLAIVSVTLTMGAQVIFFVLDLVLSQSRRGW